MTVLNQVFKVIQDGNGVASDFPFKPMVLPEPDAGDPHELLVVLTNPDGLETSITEGTGPTNYIVNVAKYPGTGSVTYPADLSSRLPTGWKITMKRLLTLDQQVRLRNQGDYNPDVLELDVADRLVMYDLQQQEELDRVLKAAVSDEPVDLTIPTVEQRANRFLGFDDIGQPIAGEAIAIPVSPYVATLVSAVNRTDLFVNKIPVSVYFYGMFDLADAVEAKAYLEVPNNPISGLIDNRLLKTDGTDGVYQQTGVMVDDSDRVSGSGTTNRTVLGTARTIAATDLGYTLVPTDTGAVTITLPQASTEDLIDGFHFQVAHIDGGPSSITFAVEGSDKLLHPFGATASAGVGALIYVYKRTDGEWYIAGGVV